MEPKKYASLFDQAMSHAKCIQDLGDHVYNQTYVCGSKAIPPIDTTNSMPLYWYADDLGFLLSVKDIEYLTNEVEQKYSVHDVSPSLSELDTVFCPIFGPIRSYGTCILDFVFSGVYINGFKKQETSDDFKNNMMITMSNLAERLDMTYDSLDRITRLNLNYNIKHSEDVKYFFKHELLILSKFLPKDKSEILMSFIKEGKDIDDDMNYSVFSVLEYMKMIGASYTVSDLADITSKANAYCKSYKIDPVFGRDNDFGKYRKYPSNVLSRFVLKPNDD